MNIKPIKTKKDYALAMTRLETLFDAKKGSSKGEAIKFRMEQLGLTQTDLAEVVGQKSRASEILNRKRKLSLEMIRQIHSSWHIPTEVLVQAY